MKCPSDQATLQMTERKGIEIDYCPQCRGVWLDRGELDKLLDKGGESGVSESRMPKNTQYRDHDDDDDYGQGNYRNGKRRKESMLGELFDF